MSTSPAGGQRPDRGERQRGQVQPAGAGRGGRVAEHQPQRVTGGGVLRPVRHQHQRPAVVHPPGQVPDQVEGRLVGPVRVLDHQQVRLRPRRLPERGGQRGEDVVPGGARRPQPGRQRRQHLGQRAERRRGGRPVAAAGGGAGDPGRVRDDPADERGLADAGLPGHEEQPAVSAGGVGEVAGRGRQLHVTLQERHAPDRTTDHLCACCRSDTPYQPASWTSRRAKVIVRVACQTGRRPGPPGPGRGGPVAAPAVPAEPSATRRATDPPPPRPQRAPPVGAGAAPPPGAGAGRPRPGRGRGRAAAHRAHRGPGRRLPGAAAGARRPGQPDGPAGHRGQRGGRAQPAPDRRAGPGPPGGRPGRPAGRAAAARHRHRRLGRRRHRGQRPGRRAGPADRRGRPGARRGRRRRPDPDRSTCARATSGCAASSSGWPAPSTAWSTSCATSPTRSPGSPGEVGTEGKLGGQAQVRGVSGTWRDLTDSSTRWPAT